MARIVEATQRNIAEAADRLRRGDVVAFPTETVYGLGAHTFNRAGLRRVYELKGRPANNPLIAHVQDASEIEDLVKFWDDRCSGLAMRFWPGPLTLVLPKTDAVPDEATAGLPTIAVRSPSHAVARQLLEAFGGPISAPSANRSGHVSPTAAEHVAADFRDVDDLLILDGGPSQVGIESTVLDLSAEAPRVLRPGAVTVEELRNVLGEIDSTHIARQTVSPGTSQSHYAPHVPAELVESSAIADRLRQERSPLAVLSFDPSRVPRPHVAIAMPQSPEEYARTLYSALRQADTAGCTRIVIEKPPESGGIWKAILDRLQRATSESDNS
jgi:L-threonylcarbamoyladenylate synthase